MLFHLYFKNLLYKKVYKCHLPDIVLIYSHQSLMKSQILNTLLVQKCVFYRRNDSVGQLYNFKTVVRNLSLFHFLLCKIITMLKRRLSTQSSLSYLNPRKYRQHPPGSMVEQCRVRNPVLDHPFRSLFLSHYCELIQTIYSFKMELCNTLLYYQKISFSVNALKIFLGI